MNIAVPEHLRLARTLADAITPETNRYGSPVVIVWPVANAPSTVTAKCAPFVTAMLKTAYAVDFKTWLGSTSPNSAAYYEAIAAGNRFAKVLKVGDIRPGDVLAIKYWAGSATASGHTALVDKVPTPRTPTKPFVTNSTQYDLHVLDVTSTPHGTADSRVSGDSEDEGVGRGTMRIYANAVGEILGYTWSVRASSYYQKAVRPLLVGRYLPGK